MRKLFKVALLAIAIALPFNSAQACDKCESTKVWVDSYRDSYGHYHDGHWKVAELCQQLAPPRRPLVVIRPPVIRIGYGHRSHSSHHTSRYRYQHSRYHGSHHTSHHRR